MNWRDHARAHSQLCEPSRSSCWCHSWPTARVIVASLDSLIFEPVRNVRHFRGRVQHADQGLTCQGCERIGRGRFKCCPPEPREIFAEGGQIEDAHCSSSESLNLSRSSAHRSSFRYSSAILSSLAFDFGQSNDSALASVSCARCRQCLGLNGGPLRFMEMDVQPLDQVKRRPTSVVIRRNFSGVGHNTFNMGSGAIFGQGGRY